MSDIRSSPSMGDDSHELFYSVVEKIRAVKANKEKDLKVTIDSLLPVIDEFKILLAHELNNVLKDFSKLKVDGLEDKRTIANAFNSLLNASGLSIKCPKTGRPSRLIARVGTAATNGHFQIEHRGSPPQVALSSVTFPEITLIPSEPDGRIHYKNGCYTGTNR